MDERQKLHTKHHLLTGALIAVVVLSLGYFDNPPNGYTGAPGDSLCTECHTLNGGMQNGSIILSGFPATINANQTYMLTVTVTNPNGIADYAGFQTVILDENGQGAGIMSAPSAGSVLTTFGNRTYHEHNPAKEFTGPNAVSWTVNWTAPVGSGQLFFYGAGNIANGNNQETGDRIVNTSVAGTLFTPVQVEITGIMDVTCFGSQDGSVTAQASFGAPGYLYQWSNGGIGPTMFGIGAGLYTVTVTDALGGTATAEAEVEQPPLLQIVSATIEHVSCHDGNDGQITLVVAGGVLPYGGADGNTITLSDLAAGQYQIIVHDAAGCQVSAQYTVTEPDPIVPDVITLHEPDCAGFENGSICIELTGGTGSYDYHWSGGSINNNCVENLEDGLYSVTVTDDNGCSYTHNFFLDEPPLLNISLLQLEHVLCAGDGTGMISIEGTGGTGNMSYQWSNGEITSSITGLVAGDYSVTVTDENGCTVEASYHIDEPEPMSGMPTGMTELSCFGDSDGTLFVQTNGGVPPYHYSWSTGSMNQSIVNLTAGMYSVTIEDQHGCTIEFTGTVSQPPQLLPNASSTGETAPGSMDGTASAAPTGGTGTYTVLWNTGSNNTTITGLPPGAYTVTVTDENSCTVQQSVIVSGVNCTLAAESSATDVQCNGEASGIARVEVSGAQGPVEFLWSNGGMTPIIDGLIAGNYSVTVTDSAGCAVILEVAVGQPEMLVTELLVTGESGFNANDIIIHCMVTGGVMPYRFLWSSGDTTGVLDSLSHGTYSVTVTDAHDCVLADTVSVEAFECMLDIEVSGTDVDCFGDSTGSASVTISGGSPPFAYQWSNGQAGAMISGLPSGEYGITVSDADNCVVQEEIVITEPEQLIVIVDTVIDATQEQGGIIEITFSGGASPYIITWTKDGVMYSESEDLTHAEAGTYFVEILDANLCTVNIGPIVVNMSTGINSNAPMQLRLWPNPVRDFLMIGNQLNNVDWQGVIISVTGAVVLRLSSLDMHTGEENFRVNTTTLEPGVYYIYMYGADAVNVIPFVKVH